MRKGLLNVSQLARMHSGTESGMNGSGNFVLTQITREAAWDSCRIQDILAPGLCRTDALLLSTVSRQLRPHRWRITEDRLESYAASVARISHHQSGITPAACIGRSGLVVDYALVRYWRSARGQAGRAVRFWLS